MVNKDEPSENEKGVIEPYNELQIISISKKLIPFMNTPVGKLNAQKIIRDIVKNSDYTKSEIIDIFNLQIRKYKENLKRVEKEKARLEKEDKEKLKSIEKEKVLEEVEKKAEAVFNKKIVTKNFIKNQPFIYDGNRIWWLWFSDEFKWIRVDEIDILNMINRSVGTDIITPIERQIVINTLKQTGRENWNLIEPNKDTWVQFKDLIVDVRTGEKFKATPRFFITNPIPHKLGESEETPTIDKLLRQWAVFNNVQDESYVKTLYEIIAYSIIPSAPLQRIICLVGSGANGKTTFLNLIEKFVGSGNVCSSEIDLLKNRFENSRLYLKLVCIIGEIDKSIFQQTSILKRLSGEDVCRIEFKGKDGFDAKLYCKPMIACNTLPETTDKSIGFFRRWLIVDFLNRFEKQTNVLNSIPEEEYEALALKSINLLKKMLESGSFTNEGSFDERRKKYEKHANPLDFFLKEQCLFEADEKIKFENFFEVYIDWLKANSYRLQTKRELGILISHHNLIQKSLMKISKPFGGEFTTTTVIKGIKWKNEENLEGYT